MYIDKSQWDATWKMKAVYEAAKPTETELKYP